MSGSRKDDHVRLAMEQGTQARRSRHFDDVRFVHHPLGSADVDSVNLDVPFAGSTWALPFYINGMTGGSEATGRINTALALAAAETGIAMASGSMSAFFKDPSSAPSFTTLRENNPNGFVMANLSANATVDQAKAAVDLIGANALQIHVNAVQEIVMPEGDRSFTHWAGNIEKICSALSVPVVVKEVGFGMSRETVHLLANLGVRTVDVAGNGGTDFARIENSRRDKQEFDLLNEWGQSAVTSVLDSIDAAKASGVTLLASGGVRTPLDVMKALALGARAVGVAGGFLAPVRDGDPQPLIDLIGQWREQLRSMMALVGAQKPADLCATDLVITGAVREFAEARGIDLSAYARRANSLTQGGPYAA